MKRGQAENVLTRRTFLAKLALLPGLPLIAGCAQTAGSPGSAAAPSRSSGPTGSPAPSAPAGWEAVLSEARQEGVVSLYAGISGGLREALVVPFENAYPGIKVNGTFGPSPEIVARLLAESQAKKHLADVIVGPATESVFTLKPAGVIAPLKPVISLPEVLDTASWLQGKLWWMDAKEPNTTLRFQGNVQVSVSYNTNLVDPRQITSFWDLLDPKWKGKIVVNDIRKPGPGGLQVRFVYRHPDLGPPFLERFFREMAITLSSNQRQMVDWLAQGQYQLAVWIDSTQVKAAAREGLPVKEIPGEQFKEGAPLSGGGGTINLAESAPHPNAARVFINWLLSRAGQSSWQDHVEQPSLRIDIPKDRLDPNSVPKPGVTYADIYNEAFFAETPMNSVTDLITKSLDNTR